MTKTSLANDCAPDSTLRNKVCTRCRAALPLERFSRDAQRADGLRPSCKDCRKTDNKRYYSEHRSEILTRQKLYGDQNRAARRDYHRRWYALSADAKLAQNRRWKSDNRERYAKQQKVYASQNREAASARTRNWNERHPDKRKAIQLCANALRNAATKDGVKPRALRAWLDQQKLTCFYCQTDCQSAYEIDHFQPLARGGRHEIDNLRMSCPSCNRRKSARCPHEFMRSVA